MYTNQLKFTQKVKKNLNEKGLIYTNYLTKSNPSLPLPYFSYQIRQPF